MQFLSLAFFTYPCELNTSVNAFTFLSDLLKFEQKCMLDFKKDASMIFDFVSEEIDEARLVLNHSKRFNSFLTFLSFVLEN